MAYQPKSRLKKKDTRKAKGAVNRFSYTDYATGVSSKYQCSSCKKWLVYHCFYKSPADKLVCGHCMMESKASNPPSPTP